MIKWIATTLSAWVMFIACGACMAVTYKCDWQVVGCDGGLVSNENWALNSTVCQSAAGLVWNTGFLHWGGFWGGEVPTPTFVGAITQAKTLPDGAFVSAVGKIATSAAGDFRGFFYFEDVTRASGMRVAASAGAMSGLSRGNVVNVIGTLGTTLDDERQISGPIVIITSTAEPLAPLSMPNCWVGGGDVPRSPPIGQCGVWRWRPVREEGKWVLRWLPSPDINNIGLLVQTWGRVTAIRQGYVDINDGSGPVRVDTTTLSSLPRSNAYVSVIGISSLYKGPSDHRRLVLPRDAGDLRSDWQSIPE